MCFNINSNIPCRSENICLDDVDLISNNRSAENQMQFFNVVIDKAIFAVDERFDNFTISQACTI